MKACDYVQFTDPRDRVACPNEGTKKFASYWFCPLHYEMEREAAKALMKA